MKIVGTIRLSDDVAQLAAQVAEAKGLGHPKIAVEAVFRTCYQRYLDGDCGHRPPATGPGPIPYDAPINAASALDDVL